MTFALTTWLWLAVYLFGYLTSPFIALPMLLGLFAGLWWDAGIAWAGLAYGIGWWVFWGAVTITNAAPFAPVIVARDIDAMNSASWLIVTSLSVVGSAVVVYMQGLVTLAAADRQSRRLAETHAQLERAHGLIRRYVPEQVADAVLVGGSEGVEQHERRKLTIFFSDLVGFTDLCEELEPEDLARVLHEYFTEMSSIAKRHGGTVDDLVGDAILVLFGAPERIDDRDQALRAVRMAVEMQQAMELLNEQWTSAGIPEVLQMRVGINTGVATVGNFGSEERTKYTALGRQVNISARMQAQCQPGKVLLSHSTWLLIRDEIPCVPKGELTLKGLSQANLGLRSHMPCR